MKQNQVDDSGLAIGFKIDNWRSASRPNQDTLTGRYCCCEPLEMEKHSEQLYSAYRQDKENQIWTYLPYGPFQNINSYREWMTSTCFNGDPCFYAVIDRNTHLAVGVASYLRMDPQNGVIEVGHINYSPQLQGTVASTEAMYLMMKNAFSLGYRRYEWKCNALNFKSRQAALRLGFQYEGIFRQAAVVKGRNRDTAWFAMIDLEWPALQRVFESWLGPQNFDRNGVQKSALSMLTRKALRATTSRRGYRGSQTGFAIRSVQSTDFTDWARVYRGYADFYQMPMTQTVLDTVWAWLMDEDHEMEGLVAVQDARLCGLAHIRRMPNPLRGIEIGFLDDLFVEPASRGNKVGEALFEALRGLARQRGWSKIRWITADENYRARALYDKVSNKTMWNTYEMAIE